MVKKLKKTKDGKTLVGYRKLEKGFKVDTLISEQYFPSLRAARKYYKTYYHITNIKFYRHIGG